MLIGLLASIVPLMLYVFLVALPGGRAAFAGIALAAVALSVTWLVFRNDPSGEILAVIGINGGAVVAAAVAQAIRTRLEDGHPRWLYPAVAVAVALAAGVPALNILGI